MKNEADKRIPGRGKKGVPLLLSIILVFCVLGAAVFGVARKISKEMSDSAIQNLSETLDLIQCTIEAILKNEAEFQTLIAWEIAKTDDPEGYVRAYEGNRTVVKLSLVLAGKDSGVSNTGDVFRPGDLDFSAGGSVNGLAVSRSYVNYMGAWAYTMRCPVSRDGVALGDLYVEYTYDALDESLPSGFYNKRAMLYIMDPTTERFVLKPKGMGERSAGHLNLDDFYRANNINDPELRAEVARCLREGENALFYHDIRQKQALNYMWSVNGGTIYLIGYVPVEAIQQEGKTVNQNIFILVAVMLLAFLLCCLFYYLSQRQQDRIRREREAERELYSQQLTQALQAAQAASNSKTTFLSNMSHDIRTPMNAVLGFTTLLAMDAENPAKVREYTKKITASGQHLLSLINDVLDVSKIESGKMVLNSEEFDLSDLLASVDAIIQPMAQARRQAFHVDVTGIHHETLLGDETRINQILINLLSNAVKYTPEGGSIWLRIIGLKQRSNQFEHIRIEVEDTGYGMTPEYLETIFDAFTRAENSTTNKVQGTGLGMAITKNLVELMGGTIDVTSQVDKGSLFRVELELRISEDQANRRFWAERGVGRVLAVDGCGEDREDICALMGGVDVPVDAVPGREEALALLDKDGPAYGLLLLDWRTLGPEGVRALREAAPQAPAVLLLEPGGEIPEPDGAGRLTKPFFVSALREALAGLHLPQEGTAPAEVEEGGLEGLHFLAAEDNEINAEILSELLEIEGASCEIVENGKLAVERFQQATPGEFDAILMDVQMPVMSGHDAARAIRGLERPDAARIPIIAMTANAFAEDEKAALDAGMDAHVPKPLDIGLLKRVVRQCREGMETA